VRIDIVADDLTGACDTGAAFPGAVVVLREPSPRAEVMVFSTDSRGLEPGDAADVVASLWRRLPPADVYYKKIDSMMRGNVGAELAAIPLRPAILCPAFPEQGRVVRGGVAWPAGVDLRGLGCEVRDAETPEDLERIATEALVRRPIPLLVGSAGLARAVAAAAGIKPAFRRSGVHQPGVAVLAVGSNHEVTRCQVRWIESHAPASYIHYEVDTRRPSQSQVRMLCSDVVERRCGGLFLCGGDTARLVCEALGVNAIRLEGELLPGVPIGRLVGGPAEGTTVVTKSGGFGAEDAIAKVIAVLGQ